MTVTPLASTNLVQVPLGSLGGVTGGLGIGAKATNTVCVGSAVSGCGAFATTDNDLNLEASLGRMLPGGGFRQVAGISLPEKFDAQIAPGQLSVSGQVGGVVTVGSRTVGKVVPFNFDVPLPTVAKSAAASAAGNKVAPQSAGTTVTKSRPTVSRAKSTVSKALKAKPSRKSEDNAGGGSK
jgi:hypothetical protein